MDGLDRERALRYMVAKLHEVFPTQWTEGELTELVAEMYEADNRYMQQARVLDAEGRAGDSFYDDDDAFESVSYTHLDVYKRQIAPWRRPSGYTASKSPLWATCTPPR